MTTTSYLLRLEAERLEAAKTAAAASGISLAQFIREGIEMRLESGTVASSAACEAALRELAATASKLARGFVLVPPAEAGDSPWSDLMNGRESA